jgi:hypothetical protein
MEDLGEMVVSELAGQKIELTPLTTGWDLKEQNNRIDEAVKKFAESQGIKL